MKKIKKILAAVMTLAMVLGMSMTSFAAVSHEPVESGNTGSIKVTGLATTEEVTVNIYQIVSWNQADGSWDVADWVTPAYVTIGDNTDIQWENIRQNDLDSDAIKAATEQKTSSGEVTFSNLPIGAYLIVAAGTNTQYAAMGTLTYTYDSTTNLMVPANTTIAAKGSTYDVTKTLTNTDDEFVFRGDVVEFTIGSTFPSFDDVNEKERAFSITDTPTGLQITDVVVYVGGTDAGNQLTFGTDYTLTSNGETLDEQLTGVEENDPVTVNFTDAFIGDNAHAGQSVTIYITAKVTSDTGFSNIAETDKGGKTEEPVTGESGTVTIKKEDENDKPLAGAVFNVYRDGELLTFVPGVGEGNYKLALNEERGIADVITPASGLITITGLEEGEYTIVETKAPDGYSIEDLTDMKEEISAEGNHEVNFTVQDSKLASLPETGGIGTTIFTIGGCIIMIAAAGLFFASRRKSSK